MRVSRKKFRNPLELPWWAVQSLEWLIGRSENYLTLDDILIKGWTQEREDMVFIEFVWPGGKQSLVTIDKTMPRSDDPASCPYFRGVGTCESGCYTEPSCQTDQPEFGWPSERYKF